MVLVEKWLFCYALICFGYVRGFISAVVHMNTCVAICLKKDLLYTCTTNIHGETKNAHRKKHSSQTHKRPTRPNNPATTRKPPNARLPNNNNNPQKLRRLLRRKHNIPPIKHNGKKELHNKRMEHEQRQTKKNL